MHVLLQKILIIIPILGLLSILAICKINESFVVASDFSKSVLGSSSSTPTTTAPRPTAPTTTAPRPRPTPSSIPYSTQLTMQIANKLGVSLRRISNLNYTGDINKRDISVSFTILDANLLESANKEQDTATVASIANKLFQDNTFTVMINGLSIPLKKINSSITSTSNSSNTSNTSNSSNSNNANVDFFNNKGLLDTVKYAKQVYDTIPLDENATRFFTLKPDSNFNLVPVLN